MHKIIIEFPSDEQIEMFGMIETQEDTYTDFAIILTTLDDRQKLELCELYAIDIKRLDSEERVILSVCTEI